RADLMKTSSLGVFLLLLSADEYFELHEYANTLVKDFLGTGFGLGSLAQISWIFPLLILILVVLLLIAKAAKEAPSKREKIAYLDRAIQFHYSTYF
ncbi:MAG: hypothetical protein ACE5DX_04250, partial [Candidatus Dojkabacteria bacterium]